MKKKIQKRLEKVVSNPYNQLQISRSRLSRLQRANLLVGKATRFVVLARRLEEGMVEVSSAGGGNQDRSTTRSSGGVGGGKKEDREEMTSRALARTALLVAEMSESFSLYFPFFLQG